MAVTSQNTWRVTSEIQDCSIVDAQAKPSLSSHNIVTRFAFRLPVSAQHSRGIEMDEDGDLVVERRKADQEENAIVIEQSHSTPLELVGLQVWRGALALADLVMFIGPSLLRDQTILELGSGTGITSIVAAMFAREVICTDVDVGGILDLIRANAARNHKYMRADFTVLPLDFCARQWSNTLAAKLTDVSVVLVADVIYDNDLTEAFVATLLKILSVPPRKTVYITLEKRYVFTVADLDCVAPCYEHFVLCLEKARAKPPGSLWDVQQLPLDFPQCFGYERVKELVLWRIVST